MPPTSRSNSAIDRHDVAHDAPGPRLIVLLATLFNAPIADAAIRCAVDAAFETGVPVAVVNVADVSVGGRGPRIDVGDPPDLAASLRRATAAAAAVGVPTSSYRMRSLHPAATLISLIRDREPALVVLGPDVERLSALRHMTAWRYRRIVRALGMRTSALLWTPTLDGLGGPEPGRAGTLRALIASWPAGRPQLW
jgi:nucleotide-binding universal stress UspA family protein